MPRKHPAAKDLATSAAALRRSDPSGSTHDIEAELERRNAALQLLQVVSVAANAWPTSTTRALQTTLDEVCGLTGWTVGHALLPDETGTGAVVSSGIWHVDDPTHLAGLRSRQKDVSFAAGVGLAGRVVATGEPEHITDVRALSGEAADRLHSSLIDEDGMRAVAGFPVMAGDEVVGVLEFFAETPVETDQMLLDVMAQVGMVLGRIVERTRYEGALLQAREVAEVASAAKTEFLSRMSHELRTPLTAVLGYAELLGMSELADQERGYVNAIEKGGTHLLALINDVLDVSRLENGELRLSVEPVDIGMVILEAVALLRPLATAHDVTLRAELPEGTPRVALADNQALRQVILNLAANAIKYNRAGGAVVISIADSRAGSVGVDVADTGRGIAAADLGSIFTPFERLGQARTVEGTGLGLGISRQLVDAMGGTLTVASETGVGTTMSVLLAASARPPRPDLQLARAAAPLTPPGSVRTVLYVEDNIVNIELMQTLFARLRPGVELVPTMLGERAVELAVARAPQLILLDVNLPDIDGDEVLRRLKADERTSNTPVVIVSADAIPSGIDRFLAAGAIGYITKPIAAARLLEFVDHAMTHSDDDAAASPRPPRAQRRRTCVTRRGASRRR